MLKLEVIDGVFTRDTFMMRGVLGHAVYGHFEPSKLRRMAGLINNEPFTYVVDEEKEVYIPADKALIMRDELYAIADYIEKSQL